MKAAYLLTFSAIGVLILLCVLLGYYTTTQSNYTSKPAYVHSVIQDTVSMQSDSVAVQVLVNIYPQNKQITTKNTCTITNTNSKPIKNIHILKEAGNSQIETSDLLKTANLTFADAETGYYIYSFKKPIPKGGKSSFDLSLTFPNNNQTSKSNKLLLDQQDRFINSATKLATPGFNFGFEIETDTPVSLKALDGLPQMQTVLPNPFDTLATRNTDAEEELVSAYC